MTNGRLLAALLFLVGLVLFLGQISARLPDYFVFVATACYVAGGACYFLARPGPAARAPLSKPLPPVAVPPPEVPSPPPVEAQHGEVVEIDDPSALDTDVFEVTGDISLPLDVQEERQLGAELEKLQRLHRSGALSDAEYEKAKARLLD